MAKRLDTVLRTPDERFADLPDYPFAPSYRTVGGGLRMHHVDEGPRDAPPVLMLHGEPSWSYLYRSMVPVVAGAGLRALAPDLIGFGRSDKPTERAAYSYQAHVDWVVEWIEQLDLRDITLICQDWGSLIGLRIAAEHQERFARIVVANGFLPTADRGVPAAFKVWRAFALHTPVFPAGTDRGRRDPTPARRARARGLRRAVPHAPPTRQGRGCSPRWCPPPPTTPRCPPTGPPGTSWGAGRSPSSPSSAPPTRSWARPTGRCASTCPGPRASPTTGCRAATSCRRTRAPRSPERRRRLDGPLSGRVQLRPPRGVALVAAHRRVAGHPEPPRHVVRQPHAHPGTAAHLVGSDRRTGSPGRADRPRPGRRRRAHGSARAPGPGTPVRAPDRRRAPARRGAAARARRPPPRDPRAAAPPRRPPRHRSRRCSTSACRRRSRRRAAPAARTSSGCAPWARGGRARRGRRDRRTPPPR